MLPNKEDVLKSQKEFEACDDACVARISRAVANRSDCGFHEAKMTHLAIDGYRRYAIALLEALERIEVLESTHATQDTTESAIEFTDVPEDIQRRVEKILRSKGLLTPKSTTQGLHDTGPEVEELYDDTKRGGSES